MNLFFLKLEFSFRILFQHRLFGWGFNTFFLFVFGRRLLPDSNFIDGFKFFWIWRWQLLINLNFFWHGRNLVLEYVEHRDNIEIYWFESIELRFHLSKHFKRIPYLWFIDFKSPSKLIFFDRVVLV